MEEYVYDMCRPLGLCCRADVDAVSEIEAVVSNLPQDKNVFRSQVPSSEQAEISILVSFSCACIYVCAVYFSS